MVYVFSPLTDPLGFIAVYFFYYGANDMIMTALKLGLFSSVLVYPFMYLGRYVHKWLLQKTWNRIVHFYVVSLIITIVFWIIMLIWRIIGEGMPEIGFNIINLVAGWIVIAAAALPFIIVGYHIHERMTQRWKMPKPISLYIVTLAMCIPFWFIMTLWLTYGVVAPYA